MKHTKEVTILILILFLLPQFIGLTVIYNYIQTEQVEEKVIVIENGKQILTWFFALPKNQRA